MDTKRDVIKLLSYGSYVFILVTFVILGFTSTESVFFGYDMPRVGLQVQYYLAKGTYITSQYFFSESTWQNVAWGPALIFFYAALLLISPDPIIVSYLLTIVNVLGIVSVIILGWKYFSPTTGLLAGAFLAFNPYWFTYSRIIYQPSPLTLLLPIAMLLHFMSIKLKPIALILLPVVWVAIFQVYIPAVAFIITSAIFLVFHLNRSSYKYLFLGVLISMVLVVPSIKFYKENPIYLGRFFSASKQFEPNEKNITERSKNVFLSFIQIPVGGMFKWQTGDSYNDFVDNYMSSYPQTSKALTLIFILSLIWSLYYSARYKDPKRGVVLAWSLCSLWFLIAVWTSLLPPRYYLISIPPVMLLLAIFFVDILKYLKQKVKFQAILLSIPLFIIFYWIVFNIQYNSFVNNYSYPRGWLHDVAETPYLYVKNSIDWAISDAKKRNCYPVISNDPNNPNFGLWMEYEYSWKYVYKRSTKINKNLNNCYYLITHNSFPTTSILFKKFGPFVAIRRD